MHCDAMMVVLGWWWVGGGGLETFKTHRVRITGNTF
jgi:hypothetical protein